LGLIDPEKGSDVQNTSSKQDQEEGLKNYADVTIYAIASFSKLDWC